MIRNQACDTNDVAACSGGGTHQNVADHISTTTQSEIDLQGTAQHVCCRAITNRNAPSADVLLKDLVGWA